MMYTNSSFSFEYNSEIIEWDMKSAGISLIQEYKLQPEKMINKLLSLSKDAMNRRIGLLSRDDKTFAKELEESFTNMTNLFIEVNNLDIDNNILSVKRDAVFTFNVEVKQNIFGNYIKFIPKNTYHAYLYLNPYEIYFKSDGDIDIKHFTGDKDVMKSIKECHSNGILNLFNEIVRIMETSQGDPKKINRFLSDFVSMYKNRELDFDYYREFSITNKYLYRTEDDVIYLDSITEDMLDYIDISYNYINIILPLIRILI